MPRAKKSPGRPKGRPVSPAEFDKNSWSVKTAAAWAGVPERTIYRMLREGLLPCLPTGAPQVQQWPQAQDGKRRRTCFKFIIPAKAFIKYWENVGRPNQGGVAA